MRRILFAIVSFATLSTAVGQASGQIANYGSSGLSNAGATSQVNSLLGPMFEANEKRNQQLENIQGSPYTSNIFLPTEVYYKNENYGGLFYRYNAYNEEIEVKVQNIETEGIRALGRDKNISIIVDGKPMSFKTFIDKNGLTQNGYLTLLSDGKYKLYKRFDVKYTEGQAAQNSFVKAIPPRFSKFTEYYLEVPGKNRIDELEMSNRKLLKLVTDNQKEDLKQYLKENKIKIKHENDVFKALEFLSK